MLTCTNTDCIFDIIHEDLTISEMSGVNLIYDLVNQLRCNFAATTVSTLIFGSRFTEYSAPR